MTRFTVPGKRRKASSWSQVGLALVTTTALVATILFLTSHQVMSAVHLSAAGGEAGLDSLPQRRARLRVDKGITLKASQEGNPSPPPARRADGRLKPQAPTSGRAFEVREGMKHAWGGYVQYAWGADELQPVSKSGSRHGQLGGLGASIIDSLSTLWLMDLEEEFNRGRDWVVSNLNFETNTGLSFFETVIRLLAGLVSAHHLSGEAVFKEKAVDLADRLLPVFGTPSGIPDNSASLPRSSPSGGGGVSCLAEIGTDTLEFGSITALTGDKKYGLAAEKGLRFLHAAHPTKGLLATDVRQSDAGEANSQMSIGARGDSYYEYLLKYWIMGGKTDDHWRARWELATDDAIRQLSMTTKNGRLTFLGEGWGGGGASPSLPHLACYWGGNVALGVMSGAVSGEKASTYRKVAADMTHACREMYATAPKGLAPDGVNVNMDDGSMTPASSAYIQRPETVESIFYMWRLTKDQKYRDWSWDIFQAIRNHTRQEAGFSGVHDVYANPLSPDNTQQSWFLAETMKYLYLIQMPDEALPLDEWVLNTEAHPCKVVPGGLGLAPAS